jgi:small-conductance mechanosensitive channel
MKNLRLAAVICLFSLFTLIAISCVPEDFTKNELLDTVKNSDLDSAIAERVREHGIKDLFPPTIVMVIGVFIPIIAITGIFLVLVIFIGLYYKKVMAMIEKGTYSPKPIHVRWDLICLLLGIILVFVGPGISVTASAFFGMRLWTIASGLIPLLVGIAFLIFYKFLKKQIKVK